MDEAQKWDDPIWTNSGLTELWNGMTEYMEYSKIRNTRNKPIIQNTKTRNLQNILKQDMEYTEYYLTQNKRNYLSKRINTPVYIRLP